MATPDEHLDVLRGLLALFRACAKVASRNGHLDTARLCHDRHDALEWLLAETAHAVDENIAV